MSQSLSNNLTSAQLDRTEDILNDICNTLCRNYSYNEMTSFAEFLLNDGKLSPEDLIKHNSVENIGEHLRLQRLIHQNQELRDMGNWCVGE